MAITTYDELKASIANWLNRDDLAAVIPDFIANAEAQMQRDVRHYKMMQRSTAPIDSRYTSVPAEWLETIRFHLVGAESRRLELTSMDDMLQLRQETQGTAGRPTHYAHIGDSLEVFPTPDAEYDAELLYYEKIPELSDTNTTNWLMQFAPDVYLYGALVHSAPFLKDDARTQVWAALYQAAVQGLNAQSEKARFGGSGMRMRVRAY